MDYVRFTIPGEPAGKGRPRFRKGGFPYTPDSTVQYENLVKTEYWTQCGTVKFPDDAMLDMWILAYYSIPRSKSNKQKDMMRRGEIRPTKKPDADNVIKIVADSLNHVAYRDDTQIVDCQVHKFYSDNPRVEVFIKQVK